MTRRTYLGSIVVLLFALPLGAADEVPADAGGCPIAEAWAVPSEVLVVAGPAATDVPLIPDDSMLACDVVVDCGVRFQEVLPLPGELGVMAINGLRFRVDESTPLSTAGAVNCWSVEVSLAVYPFEIDDVSPVFDLNSTAPPDLVYQGPICLEQATPSEVPGLGEELVVAFEVPWAFDATAGSLLVDVTVDGVAGYSGDVLLDAVDGPEVVTVVALDGPDAPAGEVFIGGPVIILDGYEGPDQPGDPRDCLADLNIPDGVRARLEATLDRAEIAADAGRPSITERLIGTYHRLVDRYERRGTISSEAADKAHAYGSRAGGIIMGPYVLADAAHELVGIRPLLTVLGPGGLVVDQIPEDSQAHGLLDEMDELMGEILFDGVIDGDDRQDLDDWGQTYRRFMSGVWRDVTRATRSLLEEGWRLFRDFWRRYQNDPEFRFFVDLWVIARDGVITSDEASALNDLRTQILELLEKLDDRNPLAGALKKLPYILNQLAVKLAKGEIASISVTPLSDGGVGIGIATKDPVWIKIFEYGVPDNADYLAGETITILVRVSNAGVVWFPTENGHEIVVQGVNDGDGLSVNINVTDLWTVLSWEWELGIDLDDLRIKKVIITGDSGERVVIEATSDDGKPVRIEVKNGQLRVEVSGTQVYPKPK